jgi:hypothetical protein
VSVASCVGFVVGANREMTPHVSTVGRDARGAPSRPAGHHSGAGWRRPLVAARDSAATAAQWCRRASTTGAQSVAGRWKPLARSWGYLARSAFDFTHTRQALGTAQHAQSGRRIGCADVVNFNAHCVKIECESHKHSAVPCRAAPKCSASRSNSSGCSMAGPARRPSQPDSSECV